MDAQLIVREGKFGVLDAIRAKPDLAESTRDKYLRVLGGYLDAGGDPIDAHQLAAYADGLAGSQRAFLSAAVKAYTEAWKDHAKAGAHPGNVDDVQAVIFRAEALQGAVKTERQRGQKAHTWLSQQQVKALLSTCGSDLAGKRDRLALGLLVAAGLRRTEAAALTFGDVLYKPVKGKMRAVLAFKGKGKRNREVPIRDSLAAAIDEWGALVGGQGRILRSIDGRGELRDGISEVGLFHIVRAHGAEVGKPGLAPHDLRRTFAQLGYEAGVPVTQISVLLGHESIETTQRYLNLDLDLETTVSDFIPF
jgi:integrase